MLINERTRLLSELASFSHLLRGSWIERYSVCSRTDCRCHQGQKHGPRRYLVVSESGCQRQKYIPNSWVDVARKGLDQYRRLQEIIGRITEINLALMKEGNDENE